MGIDTVLSHGSLCVLKRLGSLGVMLETIMVHDVESKHTQK